MTNNGQYLKNLATHFVARDWNYTRKDDIKAIRYKDAWTGYDTLGKRLQRAFDPKHLFGLDPMSKMFREFDRKNPRALKDRILSAIYSPIAWIKVSMRTDPNLPDGVLDNGGIIVFWEENGEYIQMVQPSVGELLADFLIEEPEHPHAIKINAELERLRQGYKARIAAGEVDGRKREVEPDEDE